MKETASPQLVMPRGLAPRPADAPQGRRFSPLNAPQRALVAAFVEEAKPWALRQARRSYRHLPVEMHDQAYEVASIALIDGCSDTADRRAMYGQLASHLDDALRRLHVGWCLNSSKAGLAADTVEAVPAARRTATPSPKLAAFVERDLGGLERAVLQLELGAGRDTSVVRAALRLGPRQYTRYREGGLAKLRGAIADQLGGKVCEQHTDAVVLAATGDTWAADSLATGPGRCRSCAREATALRRLLNERLAFAPWPLAIKPAGLLIAKLGAVGAVLKGKGAAATSLSSSGSGTSIGASSFGGAKAVATVLALAAAGGGTAAIAGSDDPRRTAPSSNVAKTSAAPAKTTKPGSKTSSPASRRAADRAASKRSSGKKTDAANGTTAAITPPAGAPTTSGGSTGTSPAIANTRKPDIGGTLKQTTDTVKKAVKDVTGAVPTVAVQGLPPADVGRTVDDVTGTVDSILPAP